LSYASNNQFLSLQENGSVTDNFIYTANRNSNFNMEFGFILTLGWFAPGSCQDFSIIQKYIYIRKKFDKKNISTLEMHQS
jgi:hypothetical protein